ncbi:hypothetical protein [Flavobacterium sp. LHD-85]|uniref:hypothetical protein n=1 Tax=Flavobacterium sp. LHD-85 TaxID=3071410 RepID=UPI0027DEC3B2|nr:hypothetical protein [Flavobacterium sp. LHD-85]MDQ6531046.1 hypothetical protein [Flavobacterium sp. LHD-85]
MSIKYFVFVLLLSVSCREYKETGKKTLEQEVVKGHHNEKLNVQKEEKLKKDIKIIEIGYQEKLDNLPHFRLDSISEAEYSRFPSNKSFKEVNVESDKDFFYIQGAIKKFKFKKYRDYKGEESWSGFEFMGYCGSLSLVAVRESSTADHLGFSELQLLDTSNDFQYKIISLGDSSVSVPELSPDGKLMVYFQNPEYELGTLSIVVLKVNGKTDPTGFLTEYKSSFSEGKDSIEEIKWLNDNTFYIKTSQSAGFNESGQELKYYSYYKAEI